MLTYEAPKLATGPTSTAADFMGIAQRGFANAADIANTIDARIESRAAQQRAEERQAKIDARIEQEWQQKQATNQMAAELQKAAQDAMAGKVTTTEMDKVRAAVEGKGYTGLAPKEASKLQRYKSILETSMDTGKNLTPAQEAEYDRLQAMAQAATDKQVAGMKEAGRIYGTGAVQSALDEVMKNAAPGTYDVASMLALRNAIVSPLESKAKDKATDKALDLVNKYEAGSMKKADVLKKAEEMGLDSKSVFTGIREVDKMRADQAYRNAQLGLEQAKLNIMKEEKEKSKDKMVVSIPRPDGYKQEMTVSKDEARLITSPVINGAPNPYYVNDAVLGRLEGSRTKPSVSSEDVLKLAGTAGNDKAVLAIVDAALQNKVSPSKINDALLKQNISGRNPWYNLSDWGSKDIDIDQLKQDLLR